jgi:hypothetical protein
MNDLLGGGAGVAIVLFLVVLAILWFLLPFAIFGTKDKLSELIAESKKTNEELKALRAELAIIKDCKDSNFPPFRAD